MSRNQYRITVKSSDIPLIEEICDRTGLDAQNVLSLFLKKGLNISGDTPSPPVAPRTFEAVHVDRATPFIPKEPAKPQLATGNEPPSFEFD